MGFSDQIRKPGNRRKNRNATEPSTSSEDELSSDANSSMDPLPEFSPTKNEIGILVMGLTGAGKSTLISHLTKQEVQIGHSLDSCTTVVDGYLYEHRDDRNIWLIDTPGFDDTSKANAKVLREIASSVCTFSDDKRLSIGGLIYVHRISDIRMSGSSLKSIRIFEALCGEPCFEAVTVVTTMWDGLQTETAKTAAETRESTLRSRPEFFGHLIAKGAVFQRLEDPVRNSGMIVDRLVDRGVGRGKEVVLAMQQEICADNNCTLAETSVGRYLEQDLKETGQTYAAKIVELEEYRKILATRDTGDEDDEDLQAEIFELSQLIDEAREDKGILSVTYEQLKEESRIRLVRRSRTSLEHETREEKSAQEIKLEKEISRLQSAGGKAELKATKMENVVAERNKEIRVLKQELSLATASRREKKRATLQLAVTDFWGRIWGPTGTESPAIQKPRRSESLPLESKESRSSRRSRQRDSSRLRRPHWEKRPSRSDAKALPPPGVRTQNERACLPEQGTPLSEQHAHEPEYGQTRSVSDVPYPSGTVVSTLPYGTIPQPARTMPRWEEGGPERRYPPEVTYCASPVGSMEPSSGYHGQSFQ